MAYGELHAEDSESDGMSGELAWFVPPERRVQPFEGYSSIGALASAINSWAEENSDTVRIEHVGWSIDADGTYSCLLLFSLIPQEEDVEDTSDGA